MDNIHHWYSLTFMDKPSQDVTTHANCYIGLATPQVTVREITQARISTNLTSGAVLLNCSYLGAMTVEHWNAQQ